MCEMVCFVGDNSNPNDPEIDALAWKPGMIVRVEDDGYPWSAAERVYPFEIVKAPGVAKTDLAAYLAEAAPDPQTFTLHGRRSFVFPVQTWRTAGRPLLSRAQALAQKTALPPARDPRVFGTTTPTVFGG
jgi:hypothetical protein